MRDNTIALLSLLLCSLSVVSCDEGKRFAYNGHGKEYYENYAVPSLYVNSQDVRSKIRNLYAQDRDSTLFGRYAREHYKRGGTFLWIDRYGIKGRADSLVNYVDTLTKDGIDLRRYHLEQVKENIERVRLLAFADDAQEGEINDALAEVEYYLTKAFLRCGAGMRYGFTNPRELFSKIDVRDSDSVRVTYRELFDIDMKPLTRKSLDEAVRMVQKDSIGPYLHGCQPENPLYYTLRKRLSTAEGKERNKILTNMERARWRAFDGPWKHDEYIIVNIPAYHLWAHSKTGDMTMRIGCGSRKTKTPLLNSAIERMDINPQWVIPGSITTKEIIHHAGDADYFERHNYYAQNRKTGQKLHGADITHDVISSGEYYIVQKGGEGNSLGRIIFRFKNNFAVYLHDTSSRSFFARDDRSVSHGCIRVEQPFELACFLLRGKDKDKEEKINYSMTADVNADDVKRSMLISSAPVEPKMPLFISYYTIFLTPQGTLETYPDVYGYDEIILRQILNF